LGQDVDWPPYAFEDNGSLAGFGKDIADGISAYCNGGEASGYTLNHSLNVTVVRVNWEDCWTSTDGGVIGQAIKNGSVDGCLMYTNPKGGAQQHYAEFSPAILDLNKAAGLMTLLNADGAPTVDGMDNLAGKQIVGVSGWTPTADTLAYVTNKCTGEKYASNLYVTIPAVEGNDPAMDSLDAPSLDAAMEMLKNGSVDVMYLYAGQAAEYQSCTSGATTPWNCDLWKGLGTDYAYIQTGQFGHMNNGTTLILGEIGAGKATSTVVKECLEQYMQTSGYYDICVKHSLVSMCFPNDHFPATTPAVDIWNKPTDEQTDDCSDGYCPCSVRAAVKTSGDDVTVNDGTVANNAKKHARQLPAFLMGIFGVALLQVAA